MEVLETPNDTPAQGQTRASLRVVARSMPVSCLRNMTFSWRYLYKNVLSSDQECLQWLATYGLVHNERICPECKKASFLCSRFGRWRCGICFRTVSIRQDSIFKGRKLGMRTILELLYWWSLNGKHTVVARELDCSRSVVSIWFTIFRQICEKYFVEHPLLLGGPGQDVEVSVRVITMATRQQRIVCLVEQDSGRVILYAVPNRKPATSVKIVEASVLPATRIVSKQSASYRRLCERVELLFVHPDDAHDDMDATEEVWLEFKEDLRRKHVDNDRRRDQCLKEFQFRRLMGDRTFGELLYWLHHYRV